MNNKIADMKYSSTSIGLQYNDAERDAENSYLCGLSSLFRSNEGGVQKIGDLTLTYGNTIQSFLEGKYAGLQCTSMSLAAIIKSKIRQTYTPRIINKILGQGNKLHTHLRDTEKLSDHPDGKIAIEEIPHDYFLDLGNIFGRNTKVKLAEQCQNVFTSKLPGFEEFLTLKEYLLRWKQKLTERTGFLVSIRDFSYAIILYTSGKCTLFDSHGHLRINGEFIKEKASSLKFPSVDTLEDFIIGMYGTGKQTVIAPVTVSFKAGGVSAKLGASKKVKDTKKDYAPFILRTQINSSTAGIQFIKSDDDVTYHVNVAANSQIAADDVSPFIGLMCYRL